MGTDSHEWLGLGNLLHSPPEDVIETSRSWCLCKSSSALTSLFLLLHFLSALFTYCPICATAEIDSYHKCDIYFYTIMIIHFYRLYVATEQLRPAGLSGSIWSTAFSSRDIQSRCTSGPRGSWRPPRKRTQSLIGQPVLVLHHLHSTVFLVYRWNLLCSNLCPLPLVPERAWLCPLRTSP